MTATPGTPKPATPATPKAPDTPSVPETIIELVDVTAWGPILLALTAGVIVGAIIVYVARGGIEITEDTGNA